MKPDHPVLLAAIAHVYELMEELGPDNPRTLAAWIHSAYLFDPDFVERTLAEDGIALPRATTCTPDGQALHTVDQIATAFGIPVHDAEDGLAGMDIGDDSRPCNGPVVKRQ